MNGMRDEPRPTQLHELKPSVTETRRPMLRIAWGSLSVCMVLALGVWQLRSVADVAPSEVAAAAASRPASSTIVPEAVVTSDSSVNPPPGSSEISASDAPPIRAKKPGPLSFWLEESPVQAGDRFVEVRVRRNRVDGDGALAWWTEAGTAKQGEDYQSQEKSLWSFPQGFRSTRFYIKLRPDSARAQRTYFYVAVAQPAAARTAARIIRQQVWLPRTLDHLQARR